MQDLFVLVGVSIASLRFIGVKAQWFQAVAHLFVGFLIGLACYPENRSFLLVLLSILSIVEILCFIKDKTHGSKRIS